jgi:hypothetical protein
MLRRLTTLGVALGALFVASPASAQQAGKAFGDQGELIFGADRLFALFSYTSNQLSSGGNTGTVNGTSMGFFGGLNSVYVGANPATGAPFTAGNQTFYNLPRLGFDYTIIPNLTIGGEAIAWFTLGGSTQANNAPSNPVPGGNVFGIAPRVGYIFNLSDVFAIWPRLGVSYYDANYSFQDLVQNRCNDTANANLFGLDVDPVLTISPVQHFAFTAGPTLDWGFTGGNTSTVPLSGDCSRTNSRSYSYSAVNFAINAGLLGWF